jgi:hypothetical protein
VNSRRGGGESGDGHGGTGGGGRGARRKRRTASEKESEDGGDDSRDNSISKIRLRARTELIRHRRVAIGRLIDSGRTLMLHGKTQAAVVMKEVISQKRA